MRLRIPGKVLLQGRCRPRLKVAQGAVAECCSRVLLHGAAEKQSCAGCCCKVLQQDADARCCWKVLLQGETQSCARRCCKVLLLQAETHEAAQGESCCRVLLQGAVAGWCQDSELRRVLLQAAYCFRALLQTETQSCACCCGVLLQGAVAEQGAAAAAR